MSKTFALSLLTRNRVNIARAIVKQTEVALPTFAQVERRAREQNVEQILGSLIDVVQGKDSRRLITTVASIIALRRLAGLPLEDIVASGHLYLPVIRRYFAATEPDLTRAMAAYDVLEEYALPVMMQITRMTIPLENEEEADEDDIPTVTDKVSPFVSSLPFGQVFDD